MNGEEGLLTWKEIDSADTFLLVLLLETKRSNIPLKNIGLKPLS
jgi:hypothetical protein